MEMGKTSTFHLNLVQKNKFQSDFQSVFINTFTVDFSFSAFQTFPVTANF